MKLNAQAGRNAAASRELRISNAELDGKVTRLSSAERLQKAGREARHGRGLRPGAITYLKSHGRTDGKLAAGKLDQNALAAPGADRHGHDRHGHHHHDRPDGHSYARPERDHHTRHDHRDDPSATAHDHRRCRGAACPDRAGARYGIGDATTA